MIYALKQRIKKIHWIMSLYWKIYHLIVRKNQRAIRKKLKCMYQQNTRKIRIGFLVTENEKWCCQSLFDKLKTHPKFEPVLVLSSLFPDRPLSMLREKFYKNREFFRKACGDIIEVYNPEKNEFYSLKSYKLDIIFYQQPWGICKEHSILSTSKFALPCYVPYTFEDDLNIVKRLLYSFYKILFREYVSHPVIEETYIKAGFSKNQVKAVGYPKLENYLSNISQEKKYIIYAPHHAIEPTSIRLGTFAWNGHFMLDYAKKHPKFNWVFKPHPRCKVSFLAEGLFKSRKELDDYYNEWAKIGIKCEEGNYIDLFKQTKCLITDCGSFLVEFLPTKQPVIHLRRKDANFLTNITTKIISSYYSVFDLETLKKTLYTVLEKGEDPMLQARLDKLNELQLLQSAADNIIKDLEDNFSRGVKN